MRRLPESRLLFERASKVALEGSQGDCCGWKVSENKRLGRFLIAVRDVKPGEIIMQEKPLIITPPKITLPVCLGCYSEFKPDGVVTDDGKGVKPHACQNGCGFPMCKSPLCCNSQDHKAECALAKSRGKVTIKYADGEHPLYQLIGILRALGLKDKNPDVFEKLVNLEANVEKREEFVKAMEAEEGGGGGPGGSSTSNSTELKPAAGVKLIHDFFQRTDVTEEWIVKLIGIIETNGHEIPIPDLDGHINRRVIGVYHNSSYLEHNCRPNCVKTWDLSTKEIVIRASTPIKKGDHLSISYVDPLWGTADRLSLLRMTKFFTCHCDRCKDPTELGCHVSSLRCQHLKCMNIPTSEKRGLVAPLDPFKPDGDWKCLTCKEDYNVAYVNSLIQKAGQEMDQLHDKIGDIAAKEDFVKQFSKTLSPNHFYLLEVKVELAQLYGRTSEEPLHMMSPKNLVRKINLCEELLVTLNIIYPGYNRLRALIIYELQAAVFMLSQLRRSCGDISLETHLEELMQCGKWMTEVIKVLGWESQHSIERKRAAGAERDLDNLRKAVLSLQNLPEPTATLSVDKVAAAGSRNENAKPPSSPKKGGEKELSSLDKDLEKDILEIERSHLTADDDSFIEEVF
ncbi:SET domain-containing protein SmydA-8-like [Folsomia candida]|uniref:SET domain-containing protein SmydA-8-like n=1 Tax=Folsomia candida TaxID=158441 RepID=UPI0016052D67|nr:SET domain-containing protein SmydA-8-like [Folsomia candida]